MLVGLVGGISLFSVMLHSSVYTLYSKDIISVGNRRYWSSAFNCLMWKTIRFKTGDVITTHSLMVESIGGP